jgi:hypothetical protein
MAHPLIEQIQNSLIENVRQHLRYSVKVKFSGGSVVPLYAKHKNLTNDILDLSTNYTRYWKKEYKIESVSIEEIVNKNPHIKIKV